MMLKSLILLLALHLALTSAGREYFHQGQEQNRLQPGWQEPGLWRPKWIMHRTFFGVEDSASDAIEEASGTSDAKEAPRKTVSDRVLLRLKADRSLKIYDYDHRPKWELGKASSEKKKKLFESGSEVDSTSQVDRMREAMRKRREQKLDGLWWFDGAQSKQGLVKMEFQDGECRLRHDIRCDWGKMDGYAARFGRGKIFQYKLSEKGIPIGEKVIGSFTMHVTPHRPLVSKEFLAFE